MRLPRLTVARLPKGALQPLSLALMVVMACSSDGSTGADHNSLDNNETAAKGEPGKGDAGKSDPGKSAGKDASAASTLTAGGNTDKVGTSLDAGAPTATSSGLPCDVQKTIEEHCGSCHGATPLQPGMPTLVTFAGLSADSITMPGHKTSERMLARLDADQSPMPPLNVAPDGIPAADKKLIEDYLKAGPTRSMASCTASAEPVDAGASDAGADDLSQCDYLFEVLAHNGTTPDDKVGYQPPLVEDHYECFNYQVPFTETVQGIRFDPVIDDTRVVHHWILYSIDDNKDAGSHGCGGTNRTLVKGWAPGGQPVIFPPDIGLQMPKKGATFQLEVHYNNPTNLTDVADRSGVRVCATKTLRKNMAATFWLGSVFISLPPGQTTSVSDTCTVPSPGLGPVTVMSVSPHMHTRGTHMKTTVKRANGTVETLVDKPFAFRDQVAYPATMTIMPGDQLTTTCTYKNDTTSTISFGEGTGDEMCFDFVTAYPVGGLGTGNRCIGLNPFGDALSNVFGGQTKP
ncbi:MAG: hypothetical protein JWN04_3077 [Myxococcaceae bacterium]|nr:hypothetical protein [Myxococcaceae bacterium]